MLSHEPALLGRPVDTRPLIEPEGRAIRFAGPAASLLILLAVAWQARGLEVAALLRMIPRAPLFWLFLTAYYLAGPASEFVIFRRLWSLPFGGVAALLRKLVSNELLLGYSGELYFYAWARRHAHVVAAPFGAIKDVAVLSAITGNACCLLLMLLAWPWVGTLPPEPPVQALTASAIIVLLSSAAAMLLRGRLFTLPRAELRRIAAVHTVRIATTTALAAAMWHLLLPAVPLGLWVVLSAVRQILSRLPLLPNKDVVFAGVAALLVGPGGGVATAMALMASLLLAAHLCVGAGLAAADLAGRAPR